MDRKSFRERPLFTLPQIIILLLVIGVLYFTITINRRNQSGELMLGERQIVEEQVALESTRQVELEATLEYQLGDESVEDYARNEGGLLQNGEVRVKPEFIEATPVPTLQPVVTRDPLLDAQPWQAWWKMLSDAPRPTQ
ncbi:MAG: hypothetical protein AAGD96_11445 [Chloroflexota bacterium]